MRWRQIALCGLLSALAVGCAHAPATPAASPKEQSALDAARALRKKAEALHAPVYRGPDDKAQKGEFLAGPLREWVVQRMQLHRKALHAYRDAANDAPDASTEVVALDELGEMELSLADEFVSAGVAAMPGEYDKEPGMAATFKQALRGAVAPRVESARKAFKECGSIAKAAKLTTPAATRCKQRLAKLPPAVATRDTPREPAVNAPPGLPVPDRPLVPSAQKKPCVFSGTLRTFAELDDAHGAPIAVIDDAPGVELSSLELPADQSGRVRVALSWPLHFSGTLARGSLPLVTRERLDLVKGHIWLRKGAPLTAFKPSGGHTTAYRDFRDGRASSKTQPAELSRRVECAELALDQGQGDDAEAGKGNKRVFLAGLVPLRAAPGDQKPIGLIDVPRSVVTSAFLVERRDAFARVRGEDGFSFDAWVPASALTGGGLGIGRLGTGRYTHVASQQVPLRLEPKASAPVVAALAPGAYVEVGPLDSGFVPVRVGGVFAHNRSRAFYVDARDLPRLAPAGR